VGGHSGRESPVPTPLGEEGKKVVRCGGGIEKKKKGGPHSEKKRKKGNQVQGAGGGREGGLFPEQEGRGRNTSVAGNLLAERGKGKAASRRKKGKRPRLGGGGKTPLEDQGAIKKRGRGKFSAVWRRLSYFPTLQPHRSHSLKQKRRRSEGRRRRNALPACVEKWREKKTRNAFFLGKRGSPWLPNRGERPKKRGDSQLQSGKKKKISQRSQPTQGTKRLPLCGGTSPFLGEGLPLPEKTSLGTFHHAARGTTKEKEEILRGSSRQEEVEGQNLS